MTGTKQEIKTKSTETSAFQGGTSPVSWMRRKSSNFRNQFRITKSFGPFEQPTLSGALCLMKKVLASFFFLVVTVSAPKLLFAQDVSSMTGVVTDSSGAVVPDTVVTLTNKATGVKYTQTTNSTGSYRFENVPPGPGYDANFKRAGFADLDVNNIYLTVATTRTQNATLT